MMRQDYDEAVSNVASLSIGCAGSLITLLVLVALTALWVMLK